MKKEEASQVGESLWYGGDEAATHRRGRRLYCPVMEAHTHEPAALSMHSGNTRKLLQLAQPGRASHRAVTAAINLGRSHECTAFGSGLEGSIGTPA